MNRPLIILQPPHMYYEAFYMNPSELNLNFEQDLSQYCLCDVEEINSPCKIKNDSKSSEVFDLLSTSLPKVPKQRKRIKAIFKPFIIEKTDGALEKASEEIDKDSKIFK
jgi:hypothetical protein